MVYEILLGPARTRINSALSYESAHKLTIGQLVIVPLRDQTALGIVVRESTDFRKKLKLITKALPYFLPKNQLQLLRWLEQYYPSSLSATVQLFLPSTAITRITDTTKNNLGPVNLAPLTDEQQNAIEVIAGSKDTNYMLHGVTGSGKTRIYAELTKNALQNNTSVIILTPEIGLTAPLLQYFQDAFGKDTVIAFHSQLTAVARAQAWADASVDTPRIIIGPRSALFVPVKKLSLIVVDEAHDSAYKQEQQPFYHATRVAAKLAALSGAKCVLGSATPLVADYYAFKEKKLPIIEMKELAIQSDFKRSDTVVDLRDRTLFQRSQLLSTPLLHAIEQAVKQKQQSLLFLNRRGSARTILCQHCGWQELCPRCDLALTYHADKNSVLCHVCAFNKQVPLSCPDCAKPDILFQTPGTKSIEAEVTRLFPDARVGRFDKDSTAGTKLHQSFDDIHSGKVDILVGTQMLAKGLDLPRLGVIGLVQADSSLVLPDFSATERTFQQLTQVAGRIGRGHGNGQLFVQTYQPERPLLKWALTQDYGAFYKNEISERLQYGFPPAHYMLVVQVKRATQSGASKAMTRLADLLREVPGIQVGSPAPAFHERRAGHYFWQVIIRSKERSLLLDAIAKLPPQTLFNIDPTDLL